MNIESLLKGIGPLQISRSAYDTAWVARLATKGESLGKKAAEWLKANQLPDGGWGAPAPCYYHERLISTLSAIIALVSLGESPNSSSIQRAVSAITNAIAKLASDHAGATVGFEMLAPTLMAEANRVGIDFGKAKLPANLEYHRRAKLAVLPHKVINRFFTPSFSAEMVGSELNLLDVDNLQSDNGSVSYSPSATAFFVFQVKPGDRLALQYLHQVADQDGAVPYVGPIEVFDRAWALWNISLIGDLDAQIYALCQPHLDFLQDEWQIGRGIASAKGLLLLDGDDTAVTMTALARFNRQIDLPALFSYEAPYHFRCYPLESDPSVSTNVHILEAMRHAGLTLEHPSVQKILKFLDVVRLNSPFWTDKWHTSPYYTTAHLIIACAGFVDELVERSIDWLLATQRYDGSWGFYTSTAEETAYALQALSVWQRAGNPIPRQAIRSGAAWLREHLDIPHLPLWIGKSLYCPAVAVNSAVLSALALSEL